MIQRQRTRQTQEHTPATPWDASVLDARSILCGRTQTDGVLVAAFNLDCPSADEVLQASGCRDPLTPQILEQLGTNDRIFRQAVKSGVAQSPAAETVGRLVFNSEDGNSNGTKNETHNGSIIYAVSPGSFVSQCSWFLAAHRASGNYSDEEVRSLQRLLDRWASRFNSPGENDMIRILVGHDDRIILIDPAGEQQLIDNSIDFESLMSKLRVIAEQRWPNLTEAETHDMAIDINDDPWWIRFHCRNALRVGNGHQWYLEMRPLHKNEITTVGRIEDDRVARSVGFIHDHYSDSPSLEKIAAVAGVSVFHFHRLFSQNVGVTPKQYILQKQVQVARWMLRSQRTPVSQIAHLAGFASHGHFTSTFSRIVGQSPTTYRQLARPLLS